MNAQTEAPEIKALLETHFVPHKEQVGAGVAHVPVSRPSQLKRWFKRHAIFVLTVLVPTALATIYFGLIASDVYVAESRFVVRSPQKPATTSVLGSLLQGTGITRSQDDTYSVHDYILSRDALKELDQKLAIRKAFMDRHIDIFARFPWFDRDGSFEAFYKYYGKHVTVEYDPESSISILTVRAYTAQDAYRINALLLDMAERLVNGMSDRSRNDLIRFAEHEVKIAHDQARDASLALLAFRSKQSVFEPDKQAEIQLEGVAKLQEELISTEAQLAQLKQLSPTNPQLIGLKSRADTLRTAIEAEGSKVVGGSGSLSVHASTFERLALESEFADKQVGIALETLGAARNEAMRKQLYLDRLVQPNLQDKAMEPRRIRSIFMIFVFGLIAWGVVSLIVAAVREHAD